MDLDGVFYCSHCMKKMEKEGVCPFCGFDNERVHNASPALESSTLLYGRYQLGSVIGSGGFGITYAAWDEKLCIPVAVKEYFPAEWADRDSRETDEVSVRREFERAYLWGRDRFIREARVLAMLQEIPGIVKVYDSFEENRTAYIVMEYVHGEPLSDYVKKHEIPPAKLLQMMRRPIEALIAVHRQGVLHRDITPNNLLVQEDGSIKLIDFGSAARIGQQGNTIVLTRKYAPVEQYGQNYGQLGPWTDVYGMSATIYALLSGKEPQESVSRKHGDEIRPVVQEQLSIRPWQKKALMNGLAVSPERRTQSMEEFRSALYNLPMPEEVVRRRRFLRRAAGAGAAFVMLLLIVLANFTCGLPLGRGLMYSLRNDGFHIVSRLGSDEVQELPESRFGLKVTAVDENAFSEDAALRELYIPGGIRQIGSMAFYRCPALETVSMGDGVQKLGGYAFADCEKLNTVAVPESLKDFSPEAFENASKQLTIWGVRGSAAESILKNTGKNFAVREEYEIEKGEEGAILTVCRDSSEKLVLPSVIDGLSVTSLSDKLSISGDVEEITLPDGLERLDNGILSDKKKLKKATLGSATRVLGAGAFRNSGLKELIITEYLEEIGEEAFLATDLEKLKLPAGLKSVGARAFFQTILSDVSLPDGVEQIGEQAFGACASLKELHLPEGIDEISAGLFENCMRLEYVYIPQSAAAIRMYAFRGCQAMKTMLIPETVDEIDAYAFAECTGLKYVAMPEKLESANLYMFDGCPNDMVLSGRGEHAAMKLADLKNYFFEDESAWNDVIVVGSGGENTFAMEEIDEPEVVLPSYDRRSQTVVTEVWPITREANDTIRTLALPRFATTVSANACTNMTALESVAFPESLRTVGMLSFGGCLSLGRIDLPANLEQIGDGAFMNCKSLTELTLPDSVSQISGCAFWGCEGIAQLEIPKKMSLLPDGVFARTGIEHLTVPGNVSKVRCAFFECGSLRTADIQQGVRSLWESFAGCSALETVTLPGSLEIITQNTFAGCASLKDVTFLADEFIINDQPFVTAIPKCAENEDKTLRPGEVEKIALPHGGAALANLFADCPDVTVHARRGSLMERYAAEHGLKFEPLEG